MSTAAASNAGRSTVRPCSSNARRIVAAAAATSPWASSSNARPGIGSRPLRLASAVLQFRVVERAGQAMELGGLVTRESERGMRRIVEALARGSRERHRASPVAGRLHQL